MVTIPLSIFLVLYGIVVAVFSLFAAIAFYHLSRFGYADGETIGTAIVFLFLTAVVLASTAAALAGTDWQQGIALALPFIIQPR